MDARPAVFARLLGGGFSGGAVNARALLTDAIACASLFGSVWLLLWIGAAAEASAQTPAAWSPNRMSLEPGAGDCFAHVRIENRAGHYHATETLETERGPVSIRYRTIGHHGPGADDVVEVVSLPPDVFAEPMSATIPDGETLSVCLYEWRGM